MQVDSVHVPTTNLDTITEPKPILTRRQESEKRRDDFYKQLDEARGDTTGINPIKADDDQSQTETKPAPREDLDHAEESDETESLDNKLIPKKRFDKELEKRKVLEDEIRKEREERIKLQTELSLYNKAIDTLNEQQRAPQREPELDPVDTDAHNYYMNKIKDLESKFESQKNNLSDYEIKQNFTNTVNHQAAEIVKTIPDFNEAYGYLLGIEASKGMMMGYNESQSQQYALEQLRPVAWQAYSKGQNVAEIAYKLAQNYGYKSKAAPTKDNAPNFDRIDKNMQKSHSILDEVPGVSTAVAPETAAYNSLEGFTRKLAGKNGRGTNMDEFRRAIDKLKTTSSY